MVTEVENSAEERIDTLVPAPEIDISQLPFKEYWENDDHVRAADKQKYILATANSMVEGFSLEVEPYISSKKAILPSREIYRREILRRNPGAKGISNKTVKSLLEMLTLETYLVTNETDIAFVREKENSIKELLIKNNTEIADNKNRGPNITNDDRLRFLEAMLSDDVKGSYRKTQDSMSRTELDSRQSIMKLVDFYDLVVHVFNDPTFEPQTQALPDLHPDFYVSRTLKLSDFVMTRDKAKDLLVTTRPLMMKMINNYELSGAGGGQCRSEEDENFGSFDIARCEEGDDRANFLDNKSNSYLLYWWQRFDDEGFLQFTLCKLDTFHRANANEFQLVSSGSKHKNETLGSPDVKVAIAKNIGKVGDSVATLGYVMLNREIESMSSVRYALDEKLEDLEDSNADSPITNFLSKMNRMKRRIAELDCCIEQAKMKFAKINE